MHIKEEEEEEEEEDKTYIFQNVRAFLMLTCIA
jgi:hypothetical protein